MRGRVRAPGAKPRGWGSFLRHKIGSTGQGDHPIGTNFCKWVAFDKGQVIAGLGLEAEPQGLWGSFFRHKIGSTGHGNHPIVTIFLQVGSFQRGSGHSGVRGRSGAPGLKPRGWGASRDTKLALQDRGIIRLVRFFANR